MRKFLAIVLLAMTVAPSALAGNANNADRHGGIDYRGPTLLSNPTRVIAANPGEVHSRPTTLSQVLTTVPKGTKVSVKEMTATGWAHVDVNGTDGYIDSTQLQ
jgi:uncharacterized protein YgiM (DUF1202 family)